MELRRFISERNRIVEAVKTTLTERQLCLLPLQLVELFEKSPLLAGIVRFDVITEN